MTRGISFKSTLFITILYFFFNVFHLIILTRTQMRVLSVSREMVLIAICGVLTGVFGTFKSVVEIIDHEYVCSHSYWYFLLVAIPIFLMIILSIFLVFELYHSQSPLIKTEESAHRQNSAAQGLLVFLSFYILAELPYVVLFGLGIYNPADFEQLDEYTYTQVDIFIYVNMCLGILVYCLMSSQYRATVRATFWRRNSKVAPSSGEKGVDAGSSKVTN
ncbi:hypothetical protein CAEBREN_31213 [Caenorhabditis brenneri]|uniref:G-protein coupled receptors family 1 profile domain-containing protein n=1 Tax=Caenorhabditis brenneri TaxID=135651 RepID=G0NHJ0_CAEBE|nr:hypothetical protein CAEBREN_31213 [Caenorhabditis brenneri]